ncbi:hypothetical protein ACS89_20325 [Vibrio parahaemolyticus]|uniref:hypothetical protein n=1 Tax=Vibrio parahaemolyticus TaxID=670 RepID=UPI0006A5D66E|nr:hypothetical protein [Vibrio parahaemolyticus]KOE11656.1 hypothetical protein ACS89_20325 [Vibrio parahaemolyticus]KOE19795.1 hypothetical protein ACS90_07335 [Vibrio parahaemolyticus]KOF18731.1 hypothetical protein ACX16_16445 [Vibrio parahaemolyticus]
MNTQLIAGQAIPLTPDGNWLYLKAAQAEIEIYRESSGERVTLGKSSVFNVGEGKHLGRLLISSRTDNEIEIQFGFGMFTPPVEGQSVVVQALPNVVIGQMPSVTIEHLPAVEIAPNQQLAVNQLPAVELAANQQLAVNQLPAVELAANQQLGVTALPPVEFKAPQPVNIQSLPAVTLKSTQVVKVDEQVSSNLITEAVSVFPHNMAQNATRKAITIKAAKANTASVFIDAFELEAGERITIESTAAMTLTGTAGDAVTIMEI